MKQSAPVITAQMKVADITALFPAAADIMAEYGLHCYSCDIGGVETLAEGTAMHGIDEDMLNALIADLNDEYAQQRKRPNTITITNSALTQLASIVKQASTATPYLTISHSTAAGLQLEFIAAPRKGDTVQEYKKHSITLCVDATALLHMGGATVDFTDEKFTFTEWNGTCCNGKGKCGCGAGS